MEETGLNVGRTDEIQVKYGCNKFRGAMASASRAFVHIVRRESAQLNQFPEAITACDTDGGPCVWLLLWLYM